MNTVKILAIALTVTSGLGLAYGSFTYTPNTTLATKETDTKETRAAEPGPETGFAVIGYTHARSRAPAETYAF